MLKEKNKIAYYLGDKHKIKSFIKIADEKEYVWKDGGNKKMSEFFFIHLYIDSICFDVENKIVRFQSDHFYKMAGFEIIDFSIFRIKHLVEKHLNNSYA